MSNSENPLAPIGESSNTFGDFSFSQNFFVKPALISGELVKFKIKVDNALAEQGKLNVLVHRAGAEIKEGCLKITIGVEIPKGSTTPMAYVDVGTQNPEHTIRLYQNGEDLHMSVPTGTEFAKEKLPD
jgi:hypothetical protein